jgi:hypothetical protein
MTSEKELARQIVEPIRERMIRSVKEWHEKADVRTTDLRQAVEQAIIVARKEIFIELDDDCTTAMVELVRLRLKIRKAKKRKTVSFKGLLAYVEERIAALEKSAKVQAAVEQGRTTRESPGADIIEERGCTAAPASPVSPTSPMGDGPFSPEKA